MKSITVCESSNDHSAFCFPEHSSRRISTIVNRQPDPKSVIYLQIHSLGLDESRLS
ncbi:uncharacterized protein MELLADRAFT_71790 [Melampsora larici-populina 98AG31]|uniref:Uncharacterized protein n=1 Tax=Melampsora larici-populina (strain 98AG31 / pathotype 3-4-7) TaxID=747676 RepID=F4RKH6_MELLP|nr:uncharacterized protein MELLADRAFT_71790 [Melampsora larici-populina 98AG31]EGG07179.1 hypothetical protein MELLADRAFT_71790 [Melampsora larici-populina 98AG31]